MIFEVLEGAEDRSKVSPLALYYLGYFFQKQNQPATEFFQQAAKAPTDYAFPFQMEMIPVLEAAMQANPADSRAPYYLGNLLYDWQPQRAVALWEKSAALGADFPVVYRNLAMVYAKQNGARDKVLANLEKAAKYGGNALVFSELDKLYEENGVAPEKRLALLESHQAVINRDEVIAREVNLEIFAGKADAALKLLKSRFFRAWEGGGRFSLGDSWVNVNLVRGHQQFAAKRYQEALAAYQAALELPANLQEAVGTLAGRRGEVDYWIGNAYQALGNTEKARQSWQDAAGNSAAPAEKGPGRPGEGGEGGRGRSPVGGGAAGAHVAQAAKYYQALALEKLDEGDRAKAIFDQLAADGAMALIAAPKLDGKSYATAAQRAQVADAHYLAGLGLLGLNNKDKAKQEFSAALEASPDHFAAKTALTGMAP
jgi:tetratricopeptide (TPR) repeat protein